VKQKSIFLLVSHSAIGGAQELWANLADGLRARGHEVGLWALYPAPEGLGTTAAASLGWNYVAPKRPRSITEQVALFRTLVRTLRTREPAIVLSALPAANVFAALAGWLARRAIRNILTHHSPVNTHNRWLNAIDGLTGRLPNVRSIVTVSDAVGASLSRKPRAYRAKQRTIANALPPQVETLLGELAAGMRPERPGRTIMAVGRLAEEKNYPLLIRALAEIEDARLVIIGGGPEEAALKALASEIGVSERVQLLGHRPREEALRLLSTADVFAQTSFFEGHSLALIEAAKLGLPLVVSDVPAQRDGVTAADGQICGILIDPNDASGLAHELRRLLDEPAHATAWAARARRIGAQSHFSTMIRAYENMVVQP
jgi:glycosyltransferase involved in cell wall biosynthesis